MYELLLKTNWNDILEKDLMMKTQTARHILTVKGSEFKQDDDSVILVYYNIVTGEPYLLIQIYTREIPNMHIPDIDGFEGSCIHENGITEITYVDEAIKALSS